VQKIHGVYASEGLRPRSEDKPKAPEGTRRAAYREKIWILEPLAIRTKTPNSARTRS
jgi:hypothetical protein